MYPNGVDKVVWLLSGLRCDEIIRLRLGCIRWQSEDVTVPWSDEVLPTVDPKLRTVNLES
jgi:integrase